MPHSFVEAIPFVDDVVLGTVVEGAHSIQSLHRPHILAPLILFGFGGCPSGEFVTRNEGKVANVKGAMDSPRLGHLNFVGDVGDLFRNLEGANSAIGKFG